MSVLNNTAQRADLLGPLLNLQAGPAEISEEIILDTIEIVALNALQGLEVFCERRLHLLDPSIGDECCQLRALMMLKLTEEGFGAGMKEDFQALKELVLSVEKVRTAIAGLSKEYEEAKCVVDLEREEIKAKKTRLNKQKEEDLLLHDRGSEGSAKVMEAFKAAMIKLVQQETPILQTLQRTALQVKEKKLTLISSLQAHLSKNARLIALSFILTKIKECVLDKSSEVHVLHDKMNLRGIQIEGKSFHGALVGCVMERAKQILNHESVVMIREEGAKLEGKRASLLQAAINHTLPSAKAGFQEVSFYHGCEVVMKRVKALGIPILLKARGPRDITSEGPVFSSVQLYVVDKSSGKYVPAQQPLSGQAVLVIEGISKRAIHEGVESVIKECGGVMKAVRYNLAQHRFCTAEQIAIPKTLLEAKAISEEEGSKIEEEKSIACMKGFSEVNYKAFRIEHMFAASLQS
ncbi:hypothetical protein [Estrella lausannensis]|uniref:Uncharacterized protein n=1 Tax=Estrella lausannensis TaxID=483423 RepID=A0A0H5DS31_9BACT|nr:hypothetical protein [Estrella lausannensis]CRX39531.1 hypothetical protein ELAC_2211 [Estrella lausannensis]